MTDDRDGTTADDAPDASADAPAGGSTFDQLRTVADYQFGAGAGRALFPPDERLELRTTSSGRPRQVIADRGRVVSYGVDGLFTVGVEGGRRLARAVDPPALRVVVGEESVPYVREGRNAFAKFARRVDPGLRPGDEALVVAPDDRLLGVGRAELSARAVEDFDVGVAVYVRHGAPDERDGGSGGHDADGADDPHGTGTDSGQGE